MAAQLLSGGLAAVFAGILAGVVGLGSITLYLAAFFFPEVHRRHDFFWSGVGCFYALILWLDGSQITPTELVGHLASISLMGWLGWQTLTLRRKRTPMAQQTPYTADSWPTFRREMTALALAALRQTPLRRWLPDPDQGAPAATRGIRVSALKAVGYEFVDSVESPETVVVSKVGPLFPGGKEAPIKDALINDTSINDAPSPDTHSQDAPRQRDSGKAFPRQDAPRQRGSGPDAPSKASAPGQVSPGRDSSSISAPKPAQPPAETAPKAALAKGMTWGQRTQGLVTWVQDLVRSKTAPKPKKPVIEIPPRPSSLTKRSASLDQPTPKQSVPRSAPMAPVKGDPVNADPAQTNPAQTNPAQTNPVPANPATAKNRGINPLNHAPQDAPETSNWEDDEADWI